MSDNNKVCSKCGKTITGDNFTPGYALENGFVVCYACCAEIDRRALSNAKIGQKFSMYLNVKTQELNNWPGTFKIRLHYVKRGRHNLAGVRFDVWFGYAGKNFHGTSYGNNTDVCHIKCIK